MSQKTNGCVLPLWARTNAEAHVTLLRERVVAQLPQVLGGQVFVCVPRHCIVTCRSKTHRAKERLQRESIVFPCFYECMQQACDQNFACSKLWTGEETKCIENEWVMLSFHLKTTVQVRNSSNILLHLRSSTFSCSRLALLGCCLT